jgi:hypothetical protein
VKEQIVEAQVSDSDSGTGNKSDKSPPQEQKSTKKKKYSEVTIEERYKGQNVLPSSYCKRGNKLACYVKMIVSIL